MLIWIDESVVLADLAEDEKSCRGISAIFDSVARGEHYALATRQTLSALAGNLHLSTATRNTVNIIRSNLPTLGSIADLVGLRIVATYGRSGAINRSTATEWEIPIQLIADCCIRKAVLLAENLTDAEILEQSAKQYMASQGHRMQLSVEKSHGGGSTIPRVFENHARTERRWSFCITDGDRDCPTASTSSAANECRHIAEENSLVAYHLDIPAREIENIVPFAFLDEVISITHRDKWEWHRKRLCELRTDTHTYCDFKKGMTIRNIFSLPAGTDRRRYWETLANDLSRASALQSECLEHGECRVHDDESCQCHVVYGFGDRVLEHVLQFLKGQGPHASERLARADPNKDEWVEIGRLVFEWGCAPPGIRA